MPDQVQRQRLAPPQAGPVQADPPQAGRVRPALHAMLEAGSVAVVGASGRPGSFGERMVAEVGKSPARPVTYLVNPRYPELAGNRCYPSLAELPGPVDLVLLGVPDAALEDQLRLAAGRGDRSAVIFGNAHEEQDDRSDSAVRGGLRERLAGLAESAGMELCGAGCMGFVNVGYGLRAIGYVEPDPLPAGPIALVSHSGSVFSALLRTRRAIGFTLAVSSGQELITATGSYLRYALEQPETRVLALVLEAIRQPDSLREALRAAAERDLPVVMLTAGTSATGKAMVAAHSGALAAADGGWEALTRAYGIHRVGDLAEMADTLELFALRTHHRPGRSADHGRAQANENRGIATVHDSGLERAHAVDVAEEVGVRFAAIGEQTRARLADLLDPGLLPTNPLDVWGNGAGTRELFAGSLLALAADDAVDAVALAVDLVTELDGDDAYQLAVLDAAGRTDKPVAVLSNLPSVIDSGAAALLRRAGVPVLESMRTGLLALRHLLDHQAAQQRRSESTATWLRPADTSRQPTGADPPQADTNSQPAGPSGQLAGASARRARALELLAAGERGGGPQLALLREYGIATARWEPVSDAAAALAAAGHIGYPVVLKTDEPTIAHKSDAHGVIIGIETPGRLADAYADLAARLGPSALVCEQAADGVELALGIVRDHALGPLIVVGAGGILVELIADRAVALPPVSPAQARELLAGLRVATLLDGVRGTLPADLDAVVRAVTAVSDLALDLADQIEALDINPLICGPAGAIAVDALIITRRPPRSALQPLP
jgi:acyl-CoA synthetase (NDP forming)